jgi:CubicO group peptidase (beta-lactamase class C family)
LPDVQSYASVHSHGDSGPPGGGTERTAGVTLDRDTRGSIQKRFDELVAEHGVVGAGLGVAVDGEVLEFASGYADLRGPRPMTNDTVCLIGSTTKVYTATLLMQHVAAGRADLDATVKTYLPEFTVADPDATETLTLRHLLAHMSGLGIGAYSFAERGDGAVEQYVSALAAQPQVDPPGQRFGYSNAGYVVAGRVVEVLSGLPWDQALRRDLLGPAGLSQTLTAPEEILLRPVAVPHTAEPGDPLAVAPAWGVAGWALGPTGSTLVASAGDLARFGVLHLSGGVAPDGTRVLTEDVVSQMQVPHVDLPDGLPYAAQWCLGWFAHQWGERSMRGHAGHNRGAGSHLALFPDAGGALSLVFNTVPGDAGLHHTLFAELSAELFGADKPTPWRAPAPESAEQLGRYAGNYTTDGGIIRVSVEGSELVMRSPVAPTARFRSIGDGRFGTGELDHHHAAPPAGALTPQLVFTGEDEQGRTSHVYSSVFLLSRTEGS